MKLFLLLTVFIFSFSIFANESKTQPELCWTHGQCQIGQPVTGARCFIVKSGYHPDGTIACSLRCLTMPMGSYCEPIQGHAFGICKSENYPIPSFDQNDCSAAIDQTDLP